MKKNQRYKIKVSLFFLSVVLVGVLIGGWKVYQKKKEPIQVFETMVVIRDQKRANPAEDKKYSLKRGDVISIQSENHHWSKSEYISYLLVKIRGRKSEVAQLLQPEEKNTGKKDSTGKKIKEILVARKYRINLKKVGFSGSQVISGQPLKDKVFNFNEVVEK